MFGPFFLALGWCSRRVIQGYHYRGEGQEYQNQSHIGDLMSRRVGSYNQRAPYTRSQWRRGLLIFVCDLTRK